MNRSFYSIFLNNRGELVKSKKLKESSHCGFWKFKKYVKLVLE